MKHNNLTARFILLESLDRLAELLVPPVPNIWNGEALVILRSLADRLGISDYMPAPSMSKLWPMAQFIEELNQEKIEATIRAKAPSGRSTRWGAELKHKPPLHRDSTSVFAVSDWGFIDMQGIPELDFMVDFWPTEEIEDPEPRPVVIRGINWHSLKLVCEVPARY